MIDSTKTEAALKAVHTLVIRGRNMAYGEEPHAKIADLLDGVEYLITHFFDPNDSTEVFRSYLHEVAERHSCLYAYGKFTSAEANDSR